MKDIAARELKGHNILAVERFWDSTCWMIEFKVENMAFNDTGIPFNFNLSVLLPLNGGLIPILCEKQPHFVTGFSISSRAQDSKLNHPASAVPKSLHCKNVVAFQLPCCNIFHRLSLHRS